jgi:hypothetical protein
LDAELAGHRKCCLSPPALKGKDKKIMLTLMTIQQIAPPGEQTGVFTKVSTETGKDEVGLEIKNLNLDIDLDAVDSAEKKFPLRKTYRIDLKRGVTAFRNDFEAWSGRKLTDYELSKFEADKLMTGKPVKLVVRHRKEGKKSVAVIDRFLRTVIEEQTPNPKIGEANS